MNFHTSTKNYQKEKLRSQFHLQIASQRIKYLGISLTKEVKDLFTENYKNLMKEMKKTQMDGMISHIHEQEE